MKLREEIRDQLENMKEESYRLFSAGLLPGVEGILGVRLPLLRRYAAEIVAGKNWREWLEESLRTPEPDEYFEEIMLQGMVVGCATIAAATPEQAWRERASLVRAFVPKIHNWSVCDCFCAGLKSLAGDKESLKEFLLPFVCSEREFDVRFGSVMVMNYFLDSEHLTWAIEYFDAARHPGYYARMGVAWALSSCYVSFPAETMNYLKSGSMERKTLDMTVRKILESRRVTGEEREQVLAFRSFLHGEAGSAV